MVAYVLIKYPTYQFLKIRKEVEYNPPPPGPYGTEKSVVLSGLIQSHLCNHVML